MAKRNREPIGRILKLLRERSGLTLEEAASRIGRSAGWLSVIERGQATTTVDALEDILSVYSCTWKEFIRYNEVYSKRIRGQGGTAINKNGDIIASVVSPCQWRTLETEGLKYKIPPNLIDNRVMDITPVIFEPSTTSGVLTTQGEQIWYVLCGELLVEIFINSNHPPVFQEVLREGYTMQVQSNVCHRGTNLSPKNKAELLVIRSPFVRVVDFDKPRVWNNLFAESKEFEIF